MSSILLLPAHIEKADDTGTLQTKTRPTFENQVLDKLRISRPLWDIPILLRPKKNATTLPERGFSGNLVSRIALANNSANSCHPEYPSFSTQFYSLFIH